MKFFEETYSLNELEGNIIRKTNFESRKKFQERDYVLGQGLRKCYGKYARSVLKEVAGVFLSFYVGVKFWFI